ncbi:unnamed protein product [Phytomonas sp. Hart1]|nr:unnamed protein product [Phytomonas sp. Hart1]|eukprot:CCW68620.1 unnamed protein product [Phytomonas sp. isolate Hart1]
MVWREVFVPFSRGVPARAFHGAAIIPLCQTTQISLGGNPPGLGRDACEAHDYSKPGPDSAHSSSLPIFCSSGQAIRSGHQTYSGNDALLLIGGENVEGVSEPSVWVMILHDYTWQRITFPFQNELFSFHVVDSLPSSCSSSVSSQEAKAFTETTSGTFLSPQRLRQTVLTLHERSLRHNARRSSSKASTFPGLGVEDREPFVYSTCHGSLFQLLSFPTENCGVMIFGGTQSPPIMLATNIVVPTGSLKERTAFWLFCDNTDSTYIKSILNRMSHLVQTMFAGTPFLNFLRFPEKDNNRDRFRCQSSSEASPPARFVEEADQLANEVLLSDTLSMWVRAARKRLMASSSFSN